MDELLAGPLPDISDDGFSARVMVRVGQERERDRILTYVVLALAALPALLLPVPRLSAELSSLLPLIASSGPLAAAVGLILLTLSLEDLIRERQRKL